MMRTLVPALAALSLAAAAAAHEGHHCTAPTQECLDKLTKNLAGRGWLGIELEMSDAGMGVRKVVEGSPAANAGLKPGDVLTSINGKAYAGMTEADHEAVRKLFTPGATVTYGVTRDGRQQETKVVLAEMPDTVRAQIIGAHMQEHATGATGKHAAIRELSVEKVAALLKEGKVRVVDANGKEVREKFGVIPGASLLTSASAWQPAEVKAGKDEFLVFYCANARCTASDAAAQLAQERGYKNVAVLRAGIMGWKDAGQATSPGGV